MQLLEEKEVLNMKTAASIVSWIGGIITMIINFIYLNSPTVKNLLSNNTGLIFCIVVIDITIILTILIWRQRAVNDGKKVACGVCTIIFASVIGGILTLCIPKSELYDGYISDSYINSGFNNSSAPKLRQPEINQGQPKESYAISENERIEMIAKYKKLLDDEAITKEEFDAKKAELLKR